MTRKPFHPRQSRAMRTVAFVAAWSAVAVALTAGTWTIPASGAEGDHTSATTVRWLDDSQPERRWTSLSGAPTGDEITNPHYADFENLRVTVAKTTEVGDEPISVRVEGMPGGSLGSDVDMPGSTETRPHLQQNYLQVMQCWGDPAAGDFRETCTFGASSIDSTSNLVESAAERRFPVNFRSPQGVTYFASQPEDQPTAPLYSQVSTPSTTNEQVAVPVQSDGSARFVFEAQSFRSAPHMGCGETLSDGGTRSCSLVIVPRGTVYGGTERVGRPSRNIGYGDAGQQTGSPLSPGHDYWDNRVVIPLQFASGRSACGDASSQLVSGSQLMIHAMQSWQAGLCTTSGRAFSFAPSGDEPSRQQSLRSGDLVFTSRAAENVGDEDLVYAPVAVGALSVAVQIRSTEREFRNVRLTPRLLAKLLTQHYRDSIPYELSNPAGARWPHRENAPAAAGFDEEFRALNPGVGENVLGDLVVAGPIKADAYRLLWEYLQADDDARAYLSGQPDASGVTANPFYLPSGNPAAGGPIMDETQGIGSGGQPVEGLTTLLERTRADGSQLREDVGLRDDAGAPLCLCDAELDELPRFDRSVGPLTYGTGAPTTTIDSIAHNPYAASLDHVAQRVFRGDPQRQYWDPAALSGNSVGAWVSTRSRQNLGGGIRIGGVTDAASASEFDLAMVRLQVPNSDSFVAPNAETMRAALPAQRQMGAEGDTTWADMSALDDGAYPLTIVVNAMVNLSETTVDERASYADFIEYVTTAGQVSGVDAGQLPEGYVPISDEQRAQAAAAAQRIRSYSQAEDGAEQAALPANPAVGAPRSSNPAAADAAASSGGPTLSSSPSVETTATADLASNPSATLVGGALVAGVAGALAAPFLLRRRVR